MKILDKFILFEFSKNFLLALIALTFIFFVSDYLRGVWDAEVAAPILLRYTLMNTPLIMCQMVPPSAMLGTMITLSLMNRRNELTAMHASGISLGYISFLIFGVIFISCCFTLVTYDRIIPPLNKHRTVFYWKEIKGRKDFSLDIKASKVWYRSKNYIYNLRIFDKRKNTIQGIGIYFFNNSFRLLQHVEAESASFTATGEWLLKKGVLTIFPENDTFPMSKTFSEKTLQLPETPKDFLAIEKQVETLRIKELWKFIKRNKTAGIDTKEYEVDFHSRVAVSFIPLIMGMLAVPFSVRPKRQGGLAKDLLIAVGFIFIYWLSFSISVTLGKSGGLSPPLAVWGPSVIFLIVAGYLILKSKNS